MNNNQNKAGSFRGHHDGSPTKSTLRLIFSNSVQFSNIKSKTYPIIIQPGKTEDTFTITYTTTTHAAMIHTLLYTSRDNVLVFTGYSWISMWRAWMTEWSYIALTGAAALVDPWNHSHTAPCWSNLKLQQHCLEWCEYWHFTLTNDIQSCY